MLMKLRVRYLLLVIITVAAGLASRSFQSHLPPFLGEYAGDTLWALMVYWLFRILAPNERARNVAISALIFSYCIELTQLYQAPWAQDLRQYQLIALIFGHGFLWTDLICYTVGITVGWWADLRWRAASKL